MQSDTATLPDNARLMAAMDATWPAAGQMRAGGWLLRDGAGGGQRVSAASPADDATWRSTLAEAEAAMQTRGQTPLFRLTPADGACDAALAAQDYRLHDPVVFYAAPAADLAGEGAHMAALCRAAFPPAIMEEIWADGGIGPGRLAVMTRAAGPAMRLLSRAGDSPCGVAFVAIDDDMAMVHAIEVAPRHRRRGAARLLMEGAARFALEHGAAWLTLAVTKANAPARTLYERLGMAEAGSYHYRIAPEALERTS